MNFNVCSPRTTEELLETISDYRDKPIRFGAGFTDLVLELKQQSQSNLTVINLGFLTDNNFKSITVTDKGLRIGALTTVSEISDDDYITKHYPVLSSAAIQLASRQIRQVATVGGNICTASPAGDITCVLIALRAKCEVLNDEGNLRSILLSDFLNGFRKVDLQKNEILRSVLIPHNGQKLPSLSGFIKVGTRRSMECSVVSLGYHLRTDESSMIVDAGIAIGSVAPMIMFTTSACEFLIGRKIHKMNEARTSEFASLVMEYATPISDVRGSKWYRERVLFNVSKSIFAK